MLSLVDELLQYREPDCPLPFDRSQIQGYSEAELLEISQRCNLSIHGDFRRLLLEMGRCSGGLLWGWNLSIYDQRYTPESFKDMQEWWDEGEPFNPQSTGYRDPVRHQMLSLSTVSDNYNYILFTDDNSIWWYDENKLSLERMRVSFIQYLIYRVKELNKPWHGVPICDRLVRSQTYGRLL